MYEQSKPITIPIPTEARDRTKNRSRITNGVLPVNAKLD